jgi:L-lactate dehydrogenase complex protein LldE
VVARQFDFSFGWAEVTSVRVALFVPCFVDLFYPQVGVASLRLLEHLGVEVDYPPQQTCCGQPLYNAGDHDQAGELAERFCRIFAPYDAIVCPSGSCTSMVAHHYPSLIGDHPVTHRVVELCDFLVRDLEVEQLGARLAGRAVLHVGCHGLRRLDSADSARRLLQNVLDLTLVEVPSADWCCGFGGTFAVKYPEVSTAMAERKLEPILAAEVDYLVSTDSSCLMQLGGLLSRQQQSRPRPLHVAEVLASCLEGP